MGHRTSDLELLVRVAAAAAKGSPDESLEAILSELERVGVSREPQPGARPWLEVGHSGQQLRLSAVEPVPHPGDTQIVLSLLQVALARAAEQAAHTAAQERLDMLSAASFEGIMVHENGAIIDANPRLAEMLGYERRELFGTRTMQVCVAPEDMPEVLRRLRNHVEGEYVITGIRRDGSRFRAELLSKEGTLGGRSVRITAVRDVTQREQTHALLRESEARFRVLAAKAFDFTVFSRQGVVVAVDGNLFGVMGVTAEQAIGTRILDWIPPAHRAHIQAVLEAQVESDYESELLDVNQQAVPVAIVGVPSTLDGEPVRLAGIRDLRETRRLEQERQALSRDLARSQRLESLGVLAGGLAHDFNNLLVGILGNGELLAERAVDDECREAALTIVSAAERAATLTRQMLAYSGQRELGDRRPIDIGALCLELQGLLGATLSKKARLELSVAPDSVIHGEPATIMQVMMNLLTNASDALEDRVGRILVRTERVTAPGPEWSHALGTPVTPGDWVLVEVRDTGVGMDAATCERVFEPFFSTKEKGHGLGLAACLGIVRAHGGAFLVESRLGEGSTFSMLLPAGARAADSPVARPSGPHPNPWRVLVADDEPLVRSHLRRALTRKGYVVEEASDGQSALEAVRRGGIDVVVLDMIMPDLSGAEVARQLRAEGFEVPLVISSGYYDQRDAAWPDDDRTPIFLPKPYSAAQLATALERALGGGRGARVPLAP